MDRIGDVQDQVRELVNSLEFGEEKGDPPRSDSEGPINPWEILPTRKALVEKMHEGMQGHTWNSWCTQFLLELMSQDDGPKKVLHALADIRRDLRGLGLEMPDYFRREVPTSSLNMALKHFPDYSNDELLRQVDEERKERWQQFFAGYLSRDDL